MSLSPSIPVPTDPDVRQSAMREHPAVGGPRRWSAAAQAEVPGPRSAALVPPRTDDVARLARLTHPLSLSILMATTPADTMRPHDRAALDSLLRQALRRLADEGAALGHAAADIDAVRSGATSAVAVAGAAPTDRGVAILVSPEGTHLHHLRVAPRDRVVLDPTFATRDLVRSAAEDPPFLMLVLDARTARLFHYDQRYARSVLGHDFPVLRSEDEPRSGGRQGRDRGQRERTRAFLRSVDSRLAARLEREASDGGALPVVLIANERIAAEYQAVTRSRRIATVVRTGRAAVAAVDELERVSRAALAGHVTDRAAAALDTVRVRLAHGRAVAGLASAWDAMRHAEPDLLVVERSHGPAARLGEFGLEVVADPEVPGVLDDAVDELIEAALDRGAEVVTVPDGALAREGRVALAFAGRVPAPVG
jgi:hypothetical protein